MTLEERAEQIARWFIKAINANPCDRMLQSAYADWLGHTGYDLADGWRRLAESQNRPEYLQIGIVSWEPKWVWWDTLPGGLRLGPSRQFSWGTFCDAMAAAAAVLSRVKI